MTIIVIADFKSLVKDCLDNPGLFEGKSIILWNSSGETFGIAWRAIEESCVDYNKEKVEHQAWFTSSDSMFKTDDYTALKVCCQRKDMYGYKDHGIIFNTGFFWPNGELCNWLKFINSHINDKGKISKDFVLIACAYADAFDLDENAFNKNCVIYGLQPTVEEWAQWAGQYYSPDEINPIRGFIETHHPSISFDYWLKILDSIYREMIDNEFKTIKDFSQEELDGAIRSTIAFSVPDFPYNEFFEFIQSF